MKRRIQILIRTALLPFLLCPVFILPHAAANAEGETVPMAVETTEIQMPAAPAEAQQAGTETEQTEQTEQHGGVEITEVMAKNRTCLRSENGSFPDWVELHNENDAPVDLRGWSLSDRPDEKKLTFTDTVLEPGEYLAVLISETPEGTTGYGFSLTGGETVLLRDSSGSCVAELRCEGIEKDRSLVLREDGSLRNCDYPTPGRENTKAAYDMLQNEAVRSAPVLISEAVVSDPDDLYGQQGDWIELVNVSDEAVVLDGWSITDSLDEAGRTGFIRGILAPDDYLVIPCSELGFALNAEQDELYLTDDKGELADWMPLRNIPRGGSFGRMKGENGTFYFAEATPNAENRHGKRRVSETPRLLGRDGVFNDVKEVPVELESDGTVYYHIGVTHPTEESVVCRAGFTVTETSTVRAFAVEENALPSSCVTFCFILNQHHSLPVLCLTSDSREAFNTMYGSAIKNRTLPGNLSFYEEGGSFSVPCDIKMHGDTSLILRKKGMSVRFRGGSGNDELSYDLFGGGVTSFSNLNIRAGQDQNYFIIRNELCENLALAASEHIVGTRSRYCVLYVNNDYYGIYALAEKTNEQHYAGLQGVDRDSVQVLDYEAPRDSSLYRDVFEFCYKHDMKEEENYRHFCELMDVDSLIDWMFLEGYFANSDLTFGNLKFCRSTEGDTRWKFIFYDLDATLTDSSLIQMLFLTPQSRCYQVNQMVMKLWKNDEFKDRFLKRAAELLSGPLAEEKVISEIERLAAEVEPEVERDRKNTPQSYRSWENYIQILKNTFTEKEWNQKNIKAIARYLRLTEEEKELYFGGLE